ncbi:MULTISPECIES: TMAO reductase system periplasmic protein TorT [unclassified Shewanella]|jgi:protein TorT|uniref:TMAO reductase system periplasmic protein TorT n=1 Tax=unclassified Shewanella TaxID=196818 RepID=UPI00137C29FC|nr:MULTISPECIES: TMAO reductase system periplasmic protein TorT [unclassified Shewanella]MBB1363071.1 TMAO reductase system periplasmic protein TorT [Shewanella sp. SR44-4]QHS13500.1 TMAO reductase system periplasmic protein TorT [Shewanella sp. Arc9-LZ]
MRRLIYLLIACLGTIPLLAEATSDSSWTLQQRTPFNAKIQTVKSIQYNQLTSAKKAWRICALVPHLKDAYWIGIDYGLVSKASQLGINLELFEAGSYYRKEQQLKQLEYCLNQPFDAILLGAVAPNLLDQYPGLINKPIIALVNRLDNPIITTRVGVNWYQMGWKAGHFIAKAVKNLPPSSPVTLALLTGPESVGGSDWVELGIQDAIADSPIVVSSIRHTDNNRDLYRDQLHNLLNDHVPSYILGSAVAIEAAIGTLQHKRLTGQVKLVSSYLSPATLRGLYRNKVAFSSDDQVVLQGKLAIDIAVKLLEGAHSFGDIGPQIQALEQGTVQLNMFNNSLAPADFYPIYRVTTKTNL